MRLYHKVYIIHYTYTYWYYVFAAKLYFSYFLYLRMLNKTIAVITVASADHVYVYKNLRPFFRAVLPPLPVNQLERDVWGQVRPTAQQFKI